MLPEYLRRLLYGPEQGQNRTDRFDGTGKCVWESWLG